MRTRHRREERPECVDNDHALLELSEALGASRQRPTGEGSRLPKAPRSGSALTQRRRERASAKPLPQVFRGRGCSTIAGDVGPPSAQQNENNNAEGTRHE